MTASDENQYPSRDCAPDEGRVLYLVYWYTPGVAVYRVAAMAAKGRSLSKSESLYWIVPATELFYWFISVLNCAGAGGGGCYRHCAEELRRRNVAACAGGFIQPLSVFLRCISVCVWCHLYYQASSHASFSISSFPPSTCLASVLTF